MAWILADQQRGETFFAAAARLRSMLKVRLLRLFYTALMYLATPVIMWRLIVRGIRSHAYFRRWKERFGRFPAPDFQSSIWVHAVSVGEVNAALPLIEALMVNFPDERIVVTTTTPTGSERVQKSLGDRVFHVYLPYDLPGPIRRFLDRTRPRIAVVMETEIWPNLYFRLKKQRVPIVIANARLSDRSLRGYKPVLPLVRAALSAVSWVAAQSAADGERFLQLGARPDTLSVVGNIKYDLHLPEGLADMGAQLRQVWGAARPVWMAASTHEAEEAQVLDAHARVLGRFPDALLLIAPRHPERFRAVFQLCRSYGFRTRCRSEDGLAEVQTQCFVVDTLGELLRFYSACDVAFVAGSLDSIGGHNVLEAAAQGKPVVVGPHTFNFAEVTDRLIEAGAAQRVSSGVELGAAVAKIMAQTERAASMGAAGIEAVERERGAVERIIAGVLLLLAPQGRQAQPWPARER
jgi:3-deoxy-D-manno-octulosonic-acid transferase